MHASPNQATPTMPAFVLALVLLSALALWGGQVARQVRMAPGTLLPTGSPDNKAIGRQPAAMHSEDLMEVTSGPDWKTLNTAQKLALYPLAERWAVLSETQKRRWIALALNFNALPSEEQAKLHGRMTEWASLSSQQRSQARLNYADTARLAKDDKLAQWEAYQALSTEEKSILAAGAPPKPHGAATALRPVAPEKLVQVPAAMLANPQRANSPKILAAEVPALVRAVPASTPAAIPGTEGVQPSMPAPAAITVETAPVNIPVAVPSALPPLNSASTEKPAIQTPDNSGLYPHN